MGGGPRDSAVRALGRGRGPFDESLLLFGGIPAESRPLLDDLWAWDGTARTEKMFSYRPPAMSGAVMGVSSVGRFHDGRRC